MQHRDHERLGGAIPVGPDQEDIGYREIIDAGHGRCIARAGNSVGGGAKDSHGTLASAGAGDGDERVARGFIGRERSDAEVQATLREVTVNDGEPGIGDAAQGSAVHRVLGGNVGDHQEQRQVGVHVAIVAEADGEALVGNAGVERQRAAGSEVVDVRAGEADPRWRGAREVLGQVFQCHRITAAVAAADHDRDAARRLTGGIVGSNKAEGARRVPVINNQGGGGGFRTKGEAERNVGAAQEEAVRLRWDRQVEIIRPVAGSGGVVDDIHLDRVEDPRRG